MKKLILCAVAALISTSSLAGISVTVAIPDTLTPTNESIVRNPVTLESTEFDTTQADGYPGTLILDDYQWFIGQWDHIKKNTYQSEILDLPFTFSLHGQNYGKIGITRYGYVSLIA
jgi:hypothetical protein